MKTSMIAILCLLVLNNQSAFANDVECLDKDKPVKVPIGAENTCLSMVEVNVLRGLGYHFSSVAELNGDRYFKLKVKERLAEIEWGNTLTERLRVRREEQEAAYLAKKQVDRVTHEKIRAEMVAESKRKGGVKLGMTAKAVEASNWGKPEKINRTTTAQGVTEQWCYGAGEYIYFTKGKVSAIQN